MDDGERLDLFMHITRTEFSSDRLHRYIWQASWEDNLPPMVMTGLNPSKADEVTSDPTVTRCVRRAHSLRCGSLIMLNAFSWRDTDPKALYAPDYEPLKGLKGEDRAYAASANWTKQLVHSQSLNTPDSDRFIREVALECAERGGKFIVGWGTHVDAVMPGRAEQLIDIIECAGVVPLALGLTASGAPRHPLYMPYHAQPVPYLLPENDHED